MELGYRWLKHVSLLVSLAGGEVARFTMAVASAAAGTSTVESLLRDSQCSKVSGIPSIGFNS